MSLLKANSVQIGQSSTATNNFTLSVPSSPDGTIKLARGNSGATTADVLSVASDGRISFNRPPIGSVLQVVSTAKTDVFSTSSTSFVDVTGLSASITPASTSSRILIQVCLSLGGTAGSFCVFPRIVRDSTAIFISDAAGSRVRSSAMYEVGTGASFPISLIFLDSPSSTSSLTYKIQVAVNNGANTGYVNRTVADTDSALFSRSVSSITLMEIAG